MARRKPIMLDAELVDAVKAIADRHGMTLAAYMRSLLANLLEAEQRGIFAPMALRKALLYTRLRGTGLMLLPQSVIEGCSTDEEKIEREGARIGVLLKSIGVQLDEAIDLFIENMRSAVKEKGQVIIIASSSSDRAVKAFVKGVASAYGVDARDEGDVLIVHIE